MASWIAEMRVWAFWMTCSVRRDILLDISSSVANNSNSVTGMQDPAEITSRLVLSTERLGPLPLINHFLQGLGLEELLDRCVPTDVRGGVSHARALGVLLRSIIVEREPIYRQNETVHAFAAGMFGVSADQTPHLCDDRLGSALDRLFDADRAALLTEVALAVGQRFGVQFDEFHNDSTAISVCGQYGTASDRSIRGRTAPVIAYGHSKAHRPDLKQLLFILTMTEDAHIPIAYRCTDGKVSDSRTHIETWNTLRALAGTQIFCMWPIPSCVRARTWTISIVPADALSP